MSDITKLLKRYPGLLPFRRSQAAFFCGRDEDVSTLNEMIQSERLIVLFGRSGVGKSSLLNAGLCPDLEMHGFIPFNIRLQTTKKEKGGAKKLISDALISFKTNRSIPNGYETKPELFIWEILKSCEFPFGNIPVLIFDQFEELFNSSSNESLYERQKEFISELAGLIHPEPPNIILNWLRSIEIENRTEEQLEWCKQPAIRIIIAIRSDRFFELSEWGNILPQVLRNRFELKPLTMVNAKIAIEEPANSTKISSPPFTPIFTYQASALQTILDKLGAGKKTVESTYLQIICSELEDTINDADYEGDRTQISLDDVKTNINLDTIIDSFYKNQLEKISGIDERETAQTLLEEKLISNNMRRLLREDEVNAALGPYTNLIETLQNLRLIRGDMREEQKLYEISHDVLLAPIIKAKSQREIATDIFYESQIEKFIPESHREYIKKFIEEKMLSDNKRVSITEIGASKILGKNVFLLKNLIEARLVRESIDKISNEKIYEISNERILEPMAKAKAIRQLKKEKDRLEKDYLKRKQRLDTQRKELDAQREEISTLAYEVKNSARELKSLRQYAEELDVAEKKAAKRKNLFRVMTYVSFGFLIIASVSFFRSQQFLANQKKSQGETISFLAQQEYEKGNHGIAFRLFQESERLINNDTLQKILDRHIFGRLSGSKIYISSSKQWVAVLREDSSLQLYKFENDNFNEVGIAFQKVTRCEFIPNTSILSYMSLSDSLKLRFSNYNSDNLNLITDSLLNRIKVASGDNDKTRLYTDYRFSKDGALMVLHDPRKLFFYSLKNREPISKLNKTCDSLIESFKSGASFVIPTMFSSFVLIQVNNNANATIGTGLKISRPRYLLRCSNGEIVNDGEISQVIESIQKAAVFFTDEKNRLWNCDNSHLKKRFVTNLSAKVRINGFLNDSVIVLNHVEKGTENGGTYKVSMVYNYIEKKILRDNIRGANILTSSLGSRFLEFSTKDSIYHISDQSLKDTAFESIIYVDQISGSDYFIGYDKKEKAKYWFNINNINKSILINDSISEDNFVEMYNDKPFVFSFANSRVNIRPLNSNNEIMSFPGTFASLRFFDFSIISLGIERKPFVFISNRTKYLVELRPGFNKIDYLERCFPKLSVAQRNKYGLNR